MRALACVVFLVACGDNNGATVIADAPASAGPDACVASDTQYRVFLNRGGGAYTMGPEDATMNVSSIIPADTTFPAPTVDDTEWAAFVTCVQSKFNAFAVTFVENDPSPVPHTELLILDHPSQIGQTSGLESLSPYSCDGTKGKFIQNAIPMLMWGAIGAADRCWIAAQTIASSMGLDHEFSCPDLMTWESNCGPSQDKTFTNADVPCGETSARNCMCGGATQNSAKQLTAVLGSTCR